MRRQVLLVVVASCGGAPASTRATTAVAPPATPVGDKPIIDEDVPAQDALAALGKDPDLVAWIVPKTGQLEPGGPQLTVPEGAAPVQIAIVEKHGNDVRAGVWLEHVRFALWTDKQWLLATLTHDTRVSSGRGGDFVDYAQSEPVEAVLRAGSHVRRIAHKDKSTQVRYIGALEIDGWVPDDVLAMRAPPSETFGRIPNGRRTLNLMPGTIIYAEPRWGSRELAVTANGYFVDEIKELDDAWVEVGYADGDVVVHGYYGKHEPPGRTHRPRADENPPPPTTPNQLVPGGTCLYAKDRGEPIGFIAGDASVDVEDGRDGWYALTTDTPWGPITFAVQGPTKQDLVACGPTPPTP